MKVLVATTSGQTELPTDFSWTLAGELVYLPGLECGAPDPCGCGIAFCGVASQRATTTAEVADRDLHPREVLNAVADSLVEAGWFEDAASDDALASAVAVVGPLLLAAQQLPAGTLVRRRGDDLLVRGVPLPRLDLAG